MAGSLCSRHSRLPSAIKNLKTYLVVLVANFMTWIIFSGNNSGDSRISFTKNYGLKIYHHESNVDTLVTICGPCTIRFYLTVSVVLTWVSFAPPSTTKVLTQNVPSVTISFRFYFIMIHNHTWMFMSLASDHEAENMSLNTRRTS